jgi:hypothetical protein
MTKKPPLAIIIIVIVICFALGVLNVFLTKYDGPVVSATPLPTDSPVETETALRSVLLLGVNRLDVEHPALRSIWFALFQPGGDTVYLHGIALNASAPELDPGALHEIFTWDSETGTNETFRRMLFHVLPLTPDLTIVLDDQAFSKAIDYLGGVEFQGKRMEGEGIISIVNQPTEDYEFLLEVQSEIIKAMIPEALKLAPSPELTELLNLVPEHADISLEVKDALALITPLRTVPAENVFFILLPSPE